MKRKLIVKYRILLSVPTILLGSCIVFLSGCGPTQQELAQRAEAAQKYQLARAAEEHARQERIAARKAELIRIEQRADQAAQAGNVDAALSGYKQRLQAAQGDLKEDQRLRKKIIKYVASLNAPPPLTEELRRHFVRAQTMVKMNQNFVEAAKELADAMMQAPWWADGYYNLGLLLEGAGNYAGAIRNLNFCLLANPHASNAEAIQTKIYELQVLKEDADKTSAMSGTWKNPHTGSRYTVTMKGNKFRAVHGNWVLQGVKSGNTITGTITVPPMDFVGCKCVTPEYTVPLTGEIGQDGKSITFHYIKNEYAETHWHITYSGLLAVNNTGHDEGDCISVTLKGSGPEEFTIAR